MGGDIVCDAVEGRLLQAGDMAGLRAACREAEAEGVQAVFLAHGPLGDPFVLAAGLQAAPGTVLGIRVCLATDTERHPTLLARDMTALDHLRGGGTVLAFGPPHDETVLEAATLCRAMWRHGTAESEGPQFPVPGAVNLPAPPGPDSPQLALDLTDGSDPPPDDLRQLVDLLLLPQDDPGVCQVTTA